MTEMVHVYGTFNVQYNEPDKMRARETKRHSVGERECGEGARMLDKPSNIIGQ